MSDYYTPPLPSDDEVENLRAHTRKVSAEAVEALCRAYAATPSGEIQKMLRSTICSMLSPRILRPEDGGTES